MAMIISWVAPVNPCGPYLENAPAPSYDPHHLRISPWLWFRKSALTYRQGRMAHAGHVEGILVASSSGISHCLERLHECAFVRNAPFDGRHLIVRTGKSE